MLPAMAERSERLGYMFVNDEKMLEVNNEYLGHDYYTDIITFDYDEGDVLNGDLVISLDTVRTNAELFHKSYEDELNRVIIHGILHLCGINDKGPGEREIMEANENKSTYLTERNARIRGEQRFRSPFLRSLNFSLRNILTTRQP